jgi:hypothetical protein
MQCIIKNNTVTNIAIARQRFSEHVPEFMQSTVEGPPLLGIKLLDKFHSNGKTDINKGTF